MGVVILLRLEGSTEVPGLCSFLDFLDNCSTCTGEEVRRVVGSARPTAATAGKGLKANQVSLKGDVWSGAGQHVPDEEAVGSGDRVEAASSGSAGCSRTKGSGSLGTSAADILRLASGSWMTQNWQLITLIRRRYASPQFTVMSHHTARRQLGFTVWHRRAWR